MAVDADEYTAPTVRADAIHRQWENSLNKFIRGGSVDKVFSWEHLLKDDSITVQSALLPCKILLESCHTPKRCQFLQKLASVVPNSQARFTVIRFYLGMIKVYDDSVDLLVTLVKYYPLAVTPINTFLRTHFNEYLHSVPNKGEKESEIIVWSHPYITHVFELKDSFASTIMLDWLGQFRYRAVHEFLISYASNQKPITSKAEYWLFMYKLLGIVIPGNPPTFISLNRFASVLLSVGAALSPACPLTPEHFLLMGHRLEYDIEPAPALYRNITLTPGLVGLAVHILIKFPTPSLVPFVRNIINSSQGVNIHLLGCFLYPLAILGGVNDTTVREEAGQMMKKILNLSPCPPDQRDCAFEDDYSEKCIKTQTTLVSLKLGQVLTHVAKEGPTLVEKQLQKDSRLTHFTATILCHCLAVSPDRPTNLLLSTFRLADDSTNLTILTFLMMHMKLIMDKQVVQSLKFYYLYLKNFPLLLKNASPAILKKMIKMMFSEEGPASHASVAQVSYLVMFDIWQDHGGYVYNTFYSMLNNPKYPNLESTIVMIVRRMCSGERHVDIDDMKRIIFRYLDSSTDVGIIGKCIDSLTYLCMAGMDFNQVHHIISSRFATDTKIDLPVCFFYSELAASGQYPELLEIAIDKLWEFTRSYDIETSGMAYRGLLASEIKFETSPDILENVTNLFARHEHPNHAAEFIASLVRDELSASPAQSIGNPPNPTKKLLVAFRVKDPFAAKYMVQVLFSFSAVSVNASRQQYKKQLQQNERVLSSILHRFSDQDFRQPFDGIVIIEAWTHFMVEYVTSILNMPTYHRRNSGSAELDQAAFLVEQLTRIRGDLVQFIESELSHDTSRDTMYVKALRMASITNAIYKIAVKNGIQIEDIRKIVSGDIGLLRSLVFLHSSAPEVSGSSPKTLAILVLCCGAVAHIARDTEDEDMLKMLLQACITNISPGCPDDLISQCAAVASGVVVHVYYRIRPKTPCIKDAIQIMLDSNHYFGLCFCVDSFCNSIGKPATRKFIDDVISETNKGLYVSPYRLLFMGLLLVFSFHVDNAEERELLDFLVFICNKIETATEEHDQELYLVIQALVYYNLANWQYCSDAWKKAYRTTVQLYTEKLSENFGAIPTLSLLTGFPITNLVRYFDWGPSAAGVVIFSESSPKSTQYEEGKLVSLMVARKFQESQNTLIQYKSMPDSVWDIIQDVISSGLAKQTSDTRRRLRFALEVIAGLHCRIPLSNPLQVMVGLFTRTSLQREAVKCAGIHAKFSGEQYFLFLKRYLTLSTFPQLAVECQIEVVAQIPNFIQFIPARNLRHVFSNFLSETFWQGNRSLRLEILSVLQELLKNHLSMKDIIVDSLTRLYFTHPNLHLLTPSTLLKMSQIMQQVDFYQLKLNHLVAESVIVLDFIRAEYHVGEVVGLFFSRYLALNEEYKADLLRVVVSIISSLDHELAYNSLFNTMEQSTRAILRKSESADKQEIDLNAIIAIVNTVVLMYVAHLRGMQGGVGEGCQSFLYLSECVEPQVNVDCLLTVLGDIEPWFKITKLYTDALSD